MNPVQARKTVLVCVMGLLIVATYKGRSGKVATSTRLWGTGWLAIMLGVAADFAPSIAGPFALLVLAGSITNGGDQAFVNLLERAAPGAGSAPSKPSGGTTAKPPTSKNQPPPKGVSGPVG